MNKNFRLYLFILSMVLVVLTAIIFWPYLYDNIVMPLAETMWLLLRISLLNIDQKYYWWGLILVTLLFFFYRLGQGSSNYEYDETVDQNTTLKNIEFWQIFFKFSSTDRDGEQSLKNELSRLLVSIYVSDQHTLSHFEILEALRERQIALPESIYQFLFSVPPHPKPGLKTFLKSIWLAPQKWVRHWFKRDQIELYQHTNDVLAFIETSLEINYDDKSLTQRDH
jgi:hypothetical protein